VVTAVPVEPSDSDNDCDLAAADRPTRTATVDSRSSALRIFTSSGSSNNRRPSLLAEPARQAHKSLDFHVWAAVVIGSPSSGIVHLMRNRRCE
jgi:hypothetical protein